MYTKKKKEKKNKMRDLTQKKKNKKQKPNISMVFTWLTPFYMNLSCDLGGYFVDKTGVISVLSSFCFLIVSLTPTV